MKPKGTLTLWPKGSSRVATVPRDIGSVTRFMDVAMRERPLNTAMLPMTIACFHR